MNFRFPQTLSQTELENYLCYLVSELKTNPTQLKTMDNIQCIVGQESKQNLLTGKATTKGTDLENVTLEVEYMIYDTGRAILERMKEMNNLKINQPTLQYYQNMFAHKSKGWNVPQLRKFSKLEEVPYVSAKIITKSNIQKIGRFDVTFDPIKLDANGILNLFVIASNSTKQLSFDDITKVSDAVIIHSFYDTKSFVSAEILGETAKKDPVFQQNLQKEIDAKITSYIKMSYNLSEFEDRIFDKEALILEKELNASLYQQLKTVNETISFWMSE